MAGMKYFNANRFPILLLLCLVILSAGFAGFRHESVKGTLYLKDISGDPSALKDVVISGILQDMHHGIKFDIHGERVKKSFRFYENNGDIAADMQTLGNAIRYNENLISYQEDYAISPKARIEVTATHGEDEHGLKWTETTKAADMADVYVSMSNHSYTGKKTGIERLFFYTGSYIKSEGLDFKLSEKRYFNEDDHLVSRSEGSIEMIPRPHIGTSDGRHAFTILDGEIYFTLLSTPDYKGESGIFKVEEFADSGFWLGSQDSRGQYGRVKTVVSFSLDDRELTVLGLKAVKGKLVLIILEDGMLSLQAYDPDSGELIDKLDVMSFDNYEYVGFLQSFAQENQLNICIKVAEVNSDSEEKDTSLLIASVKLEEDNLSLLHLIEGLDLDKGESIFYNLEQITEVKGKLFVFTYVRREEEMLGMPYDILEPMHYLMFVYQNDNLLYKGELVTDADEDYIADRERIQTYSGGYSSSYYEYRMIKAIEVREEIIP
jgi:hypothetical protein